MKIRICCFPRTEPNGNRAGRQSVGEIPRAGFGQRGQIIVEYVLLLAIAVMIAVVVTKTLIGRDPGNEGFIIKGWEVLIEQIGADHADHPDGKPN